MYAEYSPKNLSHLISAIWYADSDVDPVSGHIVAPTINPEIIIKLYQNTAETIISGPMTRQKQYAHVENAHYFGIRFASHVGQIFDQFPLHKLKNNSEIIQKIAGINLTTLAHRLNDLNNHSARITLLDETIHQSQFQPPSFANPHVLHALAIAHHHQGNIAIKEMAATVGLSQRQLERLFIHHVGLTPKSFCKTLRLQTVLSTLQNKPSAPLARLALDCGYTDQAHLANEFKASIGTSILNYKQSQFHPNQTKK